MKFLRIYLTFFVMFLFSGKIAFAQVQNDVKSTLTNIIELSKAKKFEEAGKFIAYYANDKKKEYKEPVLTDKDQLNFVKRVVKKIGALAGVSSSFNLSQVKQVKEGNTDLQSITVEFVSGTQKISSEFKFVTVNGKLLLAGIE